MKKLKKTKGLEKLTIKKETILGAEPVTTTGSGASCPCTDTCLTPRCAP